MFIAGHALSMPFASAEDKTLSWSEAAPYLPGLKSGVSRRENEKKGVIHWKVRLKEISCWFLSLRPTVKIPFHEPSLVFVA